MGHFNLVLEKNPTQSFSTMCLTIGIDMNGDRVKHIWLPTLVCTIEAFGYRPMFGDGHAYLNVCIGQIWIWNPSVKCFAFTIYLCMFFSTNRTKLLRKFTNNFNEALNIISNRQWSNWEKTKRKFIANAKWCSHHLSTKVALTHLSTNSNGNDSLSLV